MKQLARFLPLLLLVGLVVSVALYYRVSAHRTKLEARLQSTQAEARRTEQKLDESLAQQDELRRQLGGLDEALGAAKVRLTASETRNVEQARELVRLRQLLDSRDEQVAAVESELQRTKAALTQIQTEQGTAAEKAALAATVAQLEAELAAAREQLHTARATAAGPALPAFTTSRGRTASVVSVGPGNAFVVVNYGADHGALPTQTMQVKRGADILATVRISDVRPQHSVAQVLPDSLHGALHKGDLAVLTPSAP